MSIPKMTAEASLGPSIETYRYSRVRQPGRGNIVMQAEIEDIDFRMDGWKYSNKLWVSKDIKSGMHVTIPGAEALVSGTDIEWSFDRFHVSDNKTKSKSWYYEDENTPKKWISKEGGKIADDVALLFLEKYGLGDLYSLEHKVVLNK